MGLNPQGTKKISALWRFYPEADEAAQTPDCKWMIKRFDLKRSINPPRLFMTCQEYGKSHYINRQR